MDIMYWMFSESQSVRVVALNEVLRQASRSDTPYYDPLQSDTLCNTLVIV